MITSKINEQNKHNKGGWLLALGAVLLIFTISQANIVKLVRVSGHSMDPTLQDGQIMMFSSLHTIQRNDIVVAHAPESWGMGEKNLIKRAVGLPGDRIKITDKELYVNDKLILRFEDYIGENPVPTEFSLTKKSYFLLGDNHGNSYDSLMRYIQTVDSGSTDFTISEKDIIFGKTKVKRS